MITAYRYFKALEKLDGSENQNANFVLELFGKNAENVSVREFSELTKNAEKFLLEVKEKSGAKLDKLKTKVGKFKLITNASEMTVSRFLEYLDAETRGDKVKMLGLIYGAATPDGQKYVCEHLTAFEALNVLSFFLRLYELLREKTRCYSEARAAAAKK